ncbi:hypothetical protein EJF36_16755 [Bacillus sp. HMF5848]|uniref:DUF6044 family protein n=1 Tax=Bacillus sp. HMF5848 TaxID=2495421 RepID=UPI000F76ACC2|nr:DUF6044 family protein [Bacillus sp. HMF5848]RSK28382.1 hypothetical protein EJF36_16755 [Bacillus sp. HMF5848]
MDVKERRLIFIGLLAVVLFVSPYFILGDNAKMRVHDNLDSNIAWYRVLAESGELLGSVNATIPQVINGIPRNTYGTEFSGIVWLHVLFPSVIAYGLSQLITRMFAFLGMYLLLKHHYARQEKLAWVRVGVAVAFAFTPFWPSGMLSTLGMPLALWAFLNIKTGKRTVISWITITLLPLYASIVLGFFFFLTAIGVYWLVDAILNKRINIRWLSAIIYMTLLFMAVEYRLVYSLLFETEPTSRDEYFHARLTFWHSVRLSFKNYVLGHTHVHTIHGLVILPLSILSLFIVGKKRAWQHERLFVVLHIINAVLSIWYAFWFYKGWLPLTERFDILDKFNFARFHFLRPLILYVLFALSLKIIASVGRSWRQTAITFLVAQIIILIAFNEQIYYRKQPSIGEFYATEQFEEIRDYIGQPLPSYRVASIGIHPAIAQYNGFYTIDTYNNFYPLSYKYEFRKIIAAELEKDKKLRTYFDEWGGRCYIFVDELGKKYMFKKTSKKKIKNLELNISQFYKMGGRYIFAAVPIENAKDNQLQLDKVFESSNSAWKIYLYKALPE